MARLTTFSRAAAAEVMRATRDQKNAPKGPKVRGKPPRHLMSRDVQFGVTTTSGKFPVYPADDAEPTPNTFAVNLINLSFTESPGYTSTSQDSRGRVVVARNWYGDYLEIGTEVLCFRVRTTHGLRWFCIPVAESSETPTTETEAVYRAFEKTITGVTNGTKIVFDGSSRWMRKTSQRKHRRCGVFQASTTRPGHA
jgi:hypothetical protein